MLAHLRNGDTFTRLAAGFGVGTSTAWRYVHERGLRADLASGRRIERNRDLVGLDAAELGLRLLVA